MGSIFDLLDQALTDFYKIDLELLTYISEHSTDEELEEFLEPLFKGTISNIRKGILVRNKYREIYK